jgi:hypothetical protein
MTPKQTYVEWLENLGSADVDRVGGKNASLGEMIRHLREAGISVPSGFATTAQAYWDFLETNRLKEKIADLLEQFRNESHRDDGNGNPCRPPSRTQGRTVRPGTQRSSGVCRFSGGGRDRLHFGQSR